MKNSDRSIKVDPETYRALLVYKEETGVSIRAAVKQGVALLLAQNK